MKKFLEQRLQKRKTYMRRLIEAEQYENYAAYRKAKQREYNAAYRKRHKKKIRKRFCGWVVENQDKIKSHRAKWKKNNREKVNAYERERWSRPENLAKRRAKSARKRAALAKATPPWMTQSLWGSVGAVFRKAHKLERETGVPHHVDHIVPLRGKTVCGLHVPWNLQAIPASENWAKGNRL